MALMPLHAFLSVSAGHIFGHQAMWQSWKEGLLVLMTLAAIKLLVSDPTAWRQFKKPLNLSIIIFAAVALIVTAITRPPLVATLFGLKTDLEFLLVFGLVQLTADRGFRHLLTKVLLISSGVVIGFGLLQIYVLPADFLTQLGYGPTTVAAFQDVDPAIRSVRIISTLGGANQLGSFLILPLALVFWRILKRPRLWQVLYLASGLVVEWHTYSRSAWIGTGLALVILFVAALRKAWRAPATLILVLSAGLIMQLLVNSAGQDNKLQYYLFHQRVSDTGFKGSTDLHSLAFDAGLREATAMPLGEGLGSAGPASFHNNRTLIPESYYLQIAIETGILGLMTYLATQLLLGLNLFKRGTGCSVGLPLLATLAGMAVVNLFLHGWADSSTALTFWTLASAAVGEKT